MMARCVVCGGRCTATRSSTYCNRHYWQRRRLLEKPAWELTRLVADTEFTKRLIAIVLEEQRNQNDVADLQRGDALRSD